MIKYLYFCSVLEQLLTESNNFNDLNVLDVKRGGFNADSNYIINYLSTNYFDGGLQPLQTFNTNNFNDFLNYYFNAIASYSNFSNTEFEKLKSKLKTMFSFKVDNLNYSKQMFLLEIANTVLQAKYDFNLFTIIAD